MYLTVGDLLNIEEFRNFKVIAGEKGLNRIVLSTESLDFEFVEGVNMDRTDVFRGKSITLCSLLFAKDNPALILEAVKKLDAFKVSCFAYKPVIFSKLPQEVIDYANENAFPILEFGHDEFFEDITVAVHRELESLNSENLMEETLEKMLAGTLPEKEFSKVSKVLNPKFKRYVQVISMQDDAVTPAKIKVMTERLLQSSRLSEKAAICPFRQGYLLFLTQDHAEADRFRSQLLDVTTMIGIDLDGAFCGISTVHRIGSQMDKAVREAFWASIAAKLENTPCRNYEKLGIYRFIIPLLNSEPSLSTMEDYLGPILPGSDEEDAAGSLLDTAREYVLCGGDLQKAADRLFCHKNTVRYRIGRIRSLIDPEAGEGAFYDTFSFAMRLYLFRQLLIGDPQENQ